MNTVNGLIESVRMGTAISSEDAKDVVSTCVASILRNPNAMLFVSQLKSRDGYTAEHCLNVAILAIAFGRHLQFLEDELENLGLCGLLHDFGKIKTPPEILNKPGRLDDREMRIMQSHTVHGRNLLAAQKGLFDGVVDVAYTHHERLDGNGYPRRLKANNISEFSRIISIVDAYDAMTSDRCYAEGKTSLDAMKILVKHRDTQFDGKLVQEFIKCMGIYPPGNIVELHNGIIAIVIEANYKYKRYPLVVAVRNANKEPCKPMRIDLAHIETGKLDTGFQIKTVIKDGTYGVYKADYSQSMMMTPTPA